MLSFEFRRSAETLLREFESLAPFTNAVQALSQAFDPVSGHISGIAEGGEKLKSVAEALRSHLADVRKIGSHPEQLPNPDTLAATIRGVQSALSVKHALADFRRNILFHSQ